MNVRGVGSARRWYARMRTSELARMLGLKVRRMSTFLRVSETTTHVDEYLSPGVGDDHSCG